MSATSLAVLRDGTLELLGQVVAGENLVLQAECALDGVRVRCVYKPVSEESPLWDFPDGTLAARDMASWHIDQVLAWHIVPPTVLRDGPLGLGMCQEWVGGSNAVRLVDIVPAQAIPPGWRTVVSGVDRRNRPVVLAHADDERLARIAVFDAVINNADRKAGHLLLNAENHLYGIDHGLTFNVVPKLRTVLWGWLGEPLPRWALEALSDLRKQFDAELATILRQYLTVAEITALRQRVETLIAQRQFPGPSSDWPALPWPLW